MTARTDLQERLQLEPYDPSQDQWLWRGIALFIATPAVLCIAGAVLLSVFNQHQSSLAVMGIGSGCLGALTSFFTQNIPIRASF